MRGPDNEVKAVSQAEYFSHNKQVVLRNFVPDSQNKKLVERSLSPRSNRHSSNAGKLLLNDAAVISSQ